MSGGARVPSGYQPTGQSSADQLYQQGFGTNFGYANQVPGQVAPTAYGLTSGIVNNPYAGSQQSNINQIAGMGTGQVAPQAFQGSANLQAYGGAASPSYGSQILQAGFDPQNALYNKLFQQNQDQTNAVNAMYGLQSSPYGAGLADQSNQNFNLDWQNNLLQRMNTAAQGYGTLGSAVNNAYGGAANLGGAGLQYGAQAANLPYQTYGGNLATGLGALGTYGSTVNQAFQPLQGITSDLAQYLNIGQGATGLAQNAVQANNQNALAGWGGLGSLFGLGSGGGSTIGGDLFSGIGSLIGL